MQAGIRGRQRGGRGSVFSGTASREVCAGCFGGSSASAWAMN